MTLMIVNECKDCDKRTVCSVAERRHVLDVRIQELMDEFESDNGDISMLPHHSSCFEFTNPTPTRKIIGE